MLRLLRIKDFFLTLRGKSLNEALLSFYQHAEVNEINWLSIAVNKNVIAESFITREVEFLTKNNPFSLKMALKKEELFVRLFRNQAEEAKGQLALLHASEFNLFIDRLIEKKILQNQQQLSLLDAKNFTPAEVETENKALEWMKVSFSLLEKAILQSLTDPELLFQTLLFMGKNPKTEQEEIRVITFNLDIKFEFLSNHQLRVHIYNDKNAELGSNKKADLKGDFNFRKREMFDELVKLLSAISSGIKIV